MVTPLVVSLGALWLWNKKNNKDHKNFSEVKPSAPPLETQYNGAHYITGYIKNSYFYDDGNILKLSNIRVTNICVYPRTNMDKKYSVKISIMSGNNKVIKETMTHNDRWINLPGAGSLYMRVREAYVCGYPIKPADLQYTIYYIPQ